MLPETAASKVTATHLSRRALPYIRQSSLKQVIHNTESAIRQYDLRGKAISLGWDASRRVPMSFGALTETTLPLSWLTWVIGDLPLTSRVRTFGCRKEDSAMTRRSAFGAPKPSWSSM